MIETGKKVEDGDDDKMRGEYKRNAMNEGETIIGGKLHKKCNKRDSECGEKRKTKTRIMNMMVTLKTGNGMSVSHFLSLSLSSFS